VPRISDIGSWIDDRVGLLDAEDPGDRIHKVEAFLRVVAMIVAAEYWARAIPLWSDLGPIQRLSAPAATVLAGIAIVLPGARRIAFALLAALHCNTVAGEFPAAGNHAYLEVLLLVFAALLDESDARLHLRALRWIAVIIFVASGLQKLAHGYWTQGQYLAFSTWTPSFRPVLGLLMPADELARLATYRREIGDGPYLVSSFRLLLVSNAVWMAEVGIGLALLVPRVRVAAVAAGVLLLVAIELGARELFFGALFAHLIILFLPGNATARLVWPTAAALLILLASRVGVLPAFRFY